MNGDWDIGVRKMDKRIAVICAYNNRNCGMYSVDLAAKYFLGSLGCDYTLFVAHQKKGRDGKSLGKLQYKILENLQQLDDYSLILYWGDFINNPVYGSEDFPKRELEWGLANSRLEAYEKWKKIFLLKGYKRKQKVISVSNNFQNILPCLQSLHSADREDILGAYRNNFDLFLPRDGLSHKCMITASPDMHGKVDFGVDAAFLLDPYAIYPELQQVGSSNTFAYYFARSRLSNIPRLLMMIWLKTGCRPVPVKNWLKMNIRNPDETYFNAMSKIKSAKFIVSDTYHCLINSMNLDKNVIGIGRKVDSQDGTLGDFKKKILFDDYGLSDFYIEVDDDQKDLPARVIGKVKDFNNFSRGEILRRKLLYRARLSEEVVANS